MAAGTVIASALLAKPVLQQDSLYNAYLDGYNGTGGSSYNKETGTVNAFNGWDIVNAVSAGISIISMTGLGFFSGRNNTAQNDNPQSRSTRNRFAV